MCCASEEVCHDILKYGARKIRVIWFWNGIAHDGTILHIVMEDWIGICVILRVSEHIFQLVCFYEIAFLNIYHGIGNWKIKDTWVVLFHGSLKCKLLRPIRVALYQSVWPSCHLNDLVTLGHNMFSFKILLKGINLW